MGWLMNLILTTLCSYLGWWLGAMHSDGLALFLALNGLILGWWGSRRLVAWLDE